MLFSIFILIVVLLFYYFPMISFAASKGRWCAFIFFVLLTISFCFPPTYVNLTTTFVAILILHGMIKKKLDRDLEIKNNVFEFNLLKFFTDILPLMLFLKIISMLAVSIIILVLQKLTVNTEGTQEIVSAMSETESIFVIVSLTFAACFVAPLVEEYLFRYFLYDYLLKNKFKINMYLSAIISSLIFAFLHDSVSGIVNAFIAGLIFTYIYQKYGLWYSVLTHFIFNLIAVVITILV